MLTIDISYGRNHRNLKNMLHGWHCWCLKRIYICCRKSLELCLKKDGIINNLIILAFQDFALCLYLLTWKVDTTGDRDDLHLREVFVFTKQKGKACGRKVWFGGLGQTPSLCGG